MSLPKLELWQAISLSSMFAALLRKPISSKVRCSVYGTGKKGFRQKRKRLQRISKLSRKRNRL